MIESVALGFSITGAIFIGRHEVRFLAFAFWIIGNVLWIAYSMGIHDLHIFILMSVYFVSNAIGIHDTWENRKVAVCEVITFLRCLPTIIKLRSKLIYDTCIFRWNLQRERLARKIDLIIKMRLF